MTDDELLIWPDPDDFGYEWRREAALEFAAEETSS